MLKQNVLQYAAGPTKEFHSHLKAFGFTKIATICIKCEYEKPCKRHLPKPDKAKKMY